jgi:hypothetical protein
LDEIYFTEDILPHHFVWHSAFIGLSAHPNWNNTLPRIELKGLTGDSIPFTISSLMLNERGINPVGGATGNLTRSRIHDRMVKEAFIDFVKNNPSYIFQLYVYYKPLGIIKNIKVLLSSIPMNSWIIVFISLFLLLLLNPVLEKIRIQHLLRINIFIFSILLMSQAPLIWAYPASHVMADQLIFFIFAFILLIFSIINFAKVLFFDVELNSNKSELKKNMEKAMSDIDYKQTSINSSDGNSKFEFTFLQECLLFSFKCILLIGIFIFSLKLFVPDLITIKSNTANYLSNLRLDLLTERRQLYLLSFIQNPAVLYKTSEIAEKDGEIGIAIRDMELAIGLLELHRVDKQIKIIYMYIKYI